jgi:hypothetical protein
MVLAGGCQWLPMGDLGRKLDIGLPDVLVCTLLTVRRVLIACRHSQPQLPP